MIKYDVTKADEIINLDDIYLKINKANKNEIVYFIYRNNSEEVIGYIDLRLGHTLSLYYYGNVGYRIINEFRGHRYALKAAVAILDVAKKVGFDYLIITCSPENIASEKTIKNLGCDYIETVKLPIWHELYRTEPVKEIYRINL